MGFGKGGRTKKPRVGDPIRYRGDVVGSVTRVEGNLCWRTYPNGEALPFIWRFRNELNMLHDWPGKDNECSLENENAPAATAPTITAR